MTEQNFANHGKYVPVFHFFVLPMLIINFGNQVYWWAKHGFALHQLVAVLVAAALFLGVQYGRVFALRVQDRVICLEEKLRYEKLLPADLKARMGEFTLPQYVSLRFASDAELPELARKVLDGTVTDRKVIKQMIKGWKADYLRA